MKFEKAIQLYELEEAFDALYMLGKILGINYDSERQSHDISDLLKLTDILGKELIKRDEKFLAQHLINKAMNVTGKL